MKIELEINSCKQCPHFKEGPRQSTDWFDSGNDWYCEKAKRMIEPFVEWHEKPPIPKWCPAKKK